MEVTITGNLIEIVKDDGTEMVVNGLNIVDEGAIRWEKYNTTPPAPSGNPYLQPTPTKVTRYKIVLHFNDNRWEEIYLGEVTNQAGWTDDLTGANTAVADLSAALVVSGGGGGGGVTSVSASAPLSSSGGATPTISHQASGVTAASYTVNGEALFTVNATGHITAASNASISIPPPGSDTQVLFNDAGVTGASPDLIFDSSLQIGAVSDVGQLQLGGATTSAIGTVSSNGTLTLEGNDLTVSATQVVTINASDGVQITGTNLVVIDGIDVQAAPSNSFTVLTNGLERIQVDSDGALVVDQSVGTSGQYLKTNGAGTPPEWSDIAAGTISTTPFFYLNSGSINSIFKQNGTSDGKPLYEQVGGAGTVIWADPGTGFQWNVTPDGGTIIYFSTEDVPDPTQVTAWTIDVGGAAPLPSLSVLYGPTVQDALEQVAVAASGPRVYRALITQSGTSAPTALVLENTLGGDPTFSYDGVGNYTMDLSGLVTDDQYMVMHNGVLSAEDPNFFSTSTSGQQVFMYTTQGAAPVTANGVLNAASLTVLAY